MKNFKRTTLLNIAWAAVAIVIIFIVWLIAYACVKNDYVVPDIGSTFAAFAELFTQSSFYSAFGNTFLRTLISFAVSFVLAAALASVSAVCRPFRTVFAFIISILRTLPTMAITLMLLIWTNPRVAPAIVTALVLFPMIYSQFVAAIDGVGPRLLQMAQVYRVSPREKLTKIILPSVGSEVGAQIGAGLSLGIKIMVSAEVLSYTLNSLGGIMQQARLYAEMPRFAALTIVCIVTGLVFELLTYCLNMAFSRRRGGR